MYNDDANKQLMHIPPQPQNTNCIMDWIRNNKIWVFIIIIILILLIWWFFMRKGKAETNSGTKVQIQKTRSGQTNQLY